MSKLIGLFRKQRGSIGDVTLRILNGQTVVSEKVTKNSSKSRAQMTQRVQLRNIQNLWAAFNGSDRPSFESRPRTWSDANAFMSVNLGRIPVYLTAEEARQGACVVAAYQVTRGSLPAIAVTTAQSGALQSDINVGTLNITEETTLMEFSRAIVENNEGWMNGDQISFFNVKQSVNSVTHIPYVTVDAKEVTLDVTDDETLMVDLLGDSEGFTVVENKLGTTGPIQGGCTWVHSRRTASKTVVSTQNLIVNNQILSQYQSTAKLEEAILSYGGKVTSLFLTPNTDEVIQGA